jgi:hypothetical protein
MRSNSAPESAIAEDDDVAALRRNRAEARRSAAEQQAAAEQRKDIMSNAGKLNEPLAEGSLLARMSGAE